MKQVVALFLTIILTSCSLDKDTPNASYELASITTTDLPNEFIFGETYEVTVNYQLPSDCNFFQTLDARRAGNEVPEKREIYVAIVTLVMDNNQCHIDVLGETGSAKFSITIDEMEDYTFYLWTGISGTLANYDEVTIPVVPETTDS